MPRYSSGSVRRKPLTLRDPRSWSRPSRHCGHSRRPRRQAGKQTLFQANNKSKYAMSNKACITGSRRIIPLNRELSCGCTSCSHFKAHTSYAYSHVRVPQATRSNKKTYAVVNFLDLTSTQVCTPANSTVSALSALSLSLCCARKFVLSY